MYSGTLLDIAMTHSEALINQAQKGDEQAISRLVSLWYKRIYNFCLKYFGDHDLAMEMTQKTFISMYKSIPKLQDPERFRPWLYRIASNHCHDEGRSNKRKWTVSYGSGDDDHEQFREIKDESPGPLKKMHTDDLSAIMTESLEQLVPEQREVLIMKEFEGLKFREIAEALDVSENTVKSRMYYALSHLKKILEQRNFKLEMVYYE